jgi:Xaa-Pro aminopeptidase
MQCCKPGMYEYQLEAELLHEFFKQGCRSTAYDPIIGGGENTCILHYHENNAELKSGDLLLIDAGGEYQNYSSDITRTFPVNGKFSAEQKAIYEIVLAAQLAGIKQVHPGNPWPKIQQTMVQIITEGLAKLGILNGNVNDLIETKAYQTFYMHNSGHWLGLDTHDVGSYQINGKWRELASGMVLTVEPGIYIAANSPNIDAKWWNIGIRIEDDVLVTKDGYEVLSSGLPKEINEIEKLMNA